MNDKAAAIIDGVKSFFFALFISFLVIFTLKGCSTSTKSKIDALKQITQALSDYSSSVDVKIEMGTWGTTITVDAQDVDKEWLKSDECWESE